MQNNTFDPSDEEITPEEVPVRAPRKKKDSSKKEMLSYLHDVVFILAAILVIMMFFFRIIVVSGPSMNQTLLDGDYLLLMNNLFYRNPEAGDIVVVSKKSFKDGEPIIKRVIATEGQEVDIDFSSGVVYVDGQALEEDYTYTPTNHSESGTFPIVVEDGCVFLMGDNRNGSWDSRDPLIGCVDKREILGKAVFLMLPGTGEAGYPMPRDYSRIGGLN